MLRQFVTLPAAVLAFSMLNSAGVWAAGQRTFVASYGDDLNPCTLQLPCRSFAPAIAAVNAAGEVLVLDSAGYGPFTVTKSVSIISPAGIYAGMSPTAGVDGIVIAAGANDKVVLRGLTINGQGGNRGILISSAGTVHIEHCVISSLANNGVQVNSNGSVFIRSTLVTNNGLHGLSIFSGYPNVDVVDSQFANNTGSGIWIQRGQLNAARITSDKNFDGLHVEPPLAGTAVFASVADSLLSANTNSGVTVSTNAAGSSARVAVARSTSANNLNDGYGAYYMGAGAVYLSVSDSIAFQNAYGVTAVGGGAIASITRSTSADNFYYDIYQSNFGVLRSAGNNTLSATGSTVFGSYTLNSQF